ncbi:MAG TPA: hypothetical protein VII92_10635 [Anaerolineae bacterium]
MNAEGKPTAAVLDIRSWEELIDLLEEFDDIHLARERLKNWQSKQGWTPWAEFEKELDSA